MKNKNQKSYDKQTVSSYQMDPNKITIGFFNDSFYPHLDGVVSVLDNYARRLSKYCNVIVFVPRMAKNYDYSTLPYQVVPCAAWPVPFLEYYLPVPGLDRKFIKQVKQYHLDLVHIHSPFTVGKVGVRFAKKNKIPCIGSMHSQFKQDFQQAVKFNFMAEILNSGLIRVFKQCDECWAVNSAVGRLYYEDYHYPVLPRTMNNATEMLPVDDLREARRIICERYHLNPEEKILLFVGRINVVKNIFFLADCIKAMKEKAPEIRFKMLMVGTGPDEEKLINYVKELGIADDYVFAGRIADRQLIAQIYAAADLFTFPSVYDASSIVQIEAASQKTPGLFIRNSATACTVTDNVNGFLAEENVEDYSNCMIRVLQDHELLQKTSENAFRDLYKHWDEAIAEVYALYLQMIEKKKKEDSK